MGGETRDSSTVASPRGNYARTCIPLPSSPLRVSLSFKVHKKILDLLAAHPALVVTFTAISVYKTRAHTKTDISRDTNGCIHTFHTCSKYTKRGRQASGKCRGSPDNAHTRRRGSRGERDTRSWGEWRLC
mmetsp:Transcript_51915/g.75979  ORF Transcript_51915/g.75979 Transcript_51915/m.75979 type:complete len:130 (-) Transcript_51915:7-396(-)